MRDSNLVQESLLDLQFGYELYNGFQPKQGWLMSYNIKKEADDSLKATFYFVNEIANNFKIEIPFFPSLIVECKKEINGVEEYLRRKYEGHIHNTEIVERVDVKEFNHLNKPPREYLKVYFRTEPGFQQCLKNLKEVVQGGMKSRYRNETYVDYFQETCVEDVTGEIIQIHEYDIPYEVLVGNEHGVRCGRWYSISYDGELYKIVSDTERIVYPDLRVFAFDIETTKQPLKFPNAEFDQVMMISIMTEEFGELIVNREIVAQDIREFEYHAKDDMQSAFRISNEQTEEGLLVRFLEVILEHRPHVITTYNGSFFDWPFIAKRLTKYGIDMFNSIQFREFNEYFDCPFIIHMDCYRWVKRDSYLPMNNQGLKDVARIKLGYFPDEIDPEDMVRYATEDPQRLASYSVSDAVATYYLYMKYVHSHIFSVCSLIPLSPVQILCKGSGTLCEALLLAESVNYKVLVPPKKRTETIEYYKGHIAENITYVGGHVESMKAGIYRADFEQEFHVNGELVELIIDCIDQILENYTGSEDYGTIRDQYIKDIRRCEGKVAGKGCIYHFDVGAMYPNIILTNRLQPISMVNDDICVRCDYNNEKNVCRRKMEWVSRVEYIPPGAEEIEMIRNQLGNELFSVSDDNKAVKVAYKCLPEHRKEKILKERVVEYAKKIYKRMKRIEENREDAYICQREIPFYVETVKKFRDQRYVYKDLYKKAMQEYERNQTVENRKNLIVYESLQVAYKCVLNSFYGYVMRGGSRWFSLEMAATVCNTGGEIIKLAKEMIEKIGIPLELDTDGIWAIIPADFPDSIVLNGKRISVLNHTLNYFVCKKFTNYQYQIKSEDAKFETVAQNSIFFEMDGPYKTMIIPASTEENKLLKKRYVVFDWKNKIVELKGFELKRRGELNFIKRFQEDVFKHFNDGSTLMECYSSLASICNYWLDIIEQEGGPLDEDSIFYLFSESRNMSKNLNNYANRKSNLINTVRKMSEFLGNDILDEKLKCEFIISKYPTGAPVVERAIPVTVFRSSEKSFYLNKWLKIKDVDSLKEILDWGYYRKRFESILHRMIVIPAYLQQIENPIPRVELPVWVKELSKKEKLGFTVVKDIEDLVPKRSLSDIFYTKDACKKPKGDVIAVEEPDIELRTQIVSDVFEKQTPKLYNSAFSNYIQFNTEKWLEFYKNRLIYATMIIKAVIEGNCVILTHLNGNIERFEMENSLYFDVPNKTYFAGKEVTEMYLPDQNTTKELIKMDIGVTEIHTQVYLKFMNHFSISRVYDVPSPYYQLFNTREFCTASVECITISSFNYQKKPTFVVSTPEQFIISDYKFPGALRCTLKEFATTHCKNQRIVVFSKTDINAQLITSTFHDFYHVSLDIAPTTFLETFENLVKIHIGFNSELQIGFDGLLQIAKYAKIPLLNIDESILDIILAKEFMRNGIMPIRSEGFLPSIIRDEMHKPGYYNSYCVQLEATNSFILSILEYKATTADISLYYGYKRKDFEVLRSFLKTLVVASLRGNPELKSLLSKVPQWIKKDSRIISTDLRDIVEATHQRYNICLISALKENQIKVVAASKDLIMIDSEKTTLDGCNAFIAYLKKKAASVPGYELLNLRTVRIFDKLGLVEQANYVCLENNGEIGGLSEYVIPIQFLRSYFSHEEIKNDEMYALVKLVDRKTLSLMLRLLSYQRDIHGLASNCYRLMKCSEFEDIEEFEFNLNVFCKRCGSENFLRKRCLKCYTIIDKAVIEDAAIEYLKYCWKMQIFGDRSCMKCGGAEERRLKDYCSCGGKFVRKMYRDELQKLRDFVASKGFDLEFEKFAVFFA